MTYIVLFFTVMVGFIIFQTLPDKKQGGMSDKTNKLLRILSLTGAVGVIVYLVNILRDIVSQDVTFGAIVSSLMIALAILAICNLIYFATARYNNEKSRANVAEYRLHLINKGKSFQQVLDCSSTAIDYAKMEVEAKEWAEKVANKPVKIYYD